jgi:hypothetical protein
MASLYDVVGGHVHQKTGRCEPRHEMTPSRIEKCTPTGSHLSKRGVQIFFHKTFAGVEAGMWF